MFQRQTPRGTVATHERLSFERSGLRTFAHVHPGFAHVHPGFAHVRRMFADVCTRPPRVCTRSPNVCRRLHTSTQGLHTASKGSLVRAHSQQGKLGSCTLPAREAWFVHTASKGSLVRAHSQQGKLGSCHRAPPVASSSPGGRWHRAPPVAVNCGTLPAIELDHQVLLLDTPVAGFLLPVSYFRFPTSGFLLPVSYFPNALRTHKRTHCERMIRSPSAAAGYHGGRHSWNTARPSSSNGGRWHRARSPSAAGYHGGRHSWNTPRPSSSRAAGGIELDHQVLLDTMVAVTRGILPGHRAPPVAVGIELDHQVLLDTTVAVTRGMLISWVPGIDVSTANPQGNCSDPRETFFTSALCIS